MFKKIFSELAALGKSRIVIVGIFFGVLFMTIVIRLFNLQIINGENYLTSFTYRIKKETQLPSVRGSIYDRNGKLLAYNRLAYSVVIDDSQMKTNDEENAIIYQTISMIEKCGYSAENNLPIQINKDGTMEYTVSGNSLLRFIKNVYGKDNVKDLSEAQKNATVTELFDYMKYGDDDNEMFGISDTYSDSDALKIAAVRYELYMKRYEQYLSVTMVSDINDALIAIIKENGDTLTGIAIEEDYIRQYNDSECFSNIIGYTGQISEDELAQMEDSGQEGYSSGDIIGKSGLEQSFESELKGTKGMQTVYVNSLGNVLEEAQNIPSVAGQDLYLTIDKDLQVAAYNRLEEEITTLILSRLVDDHADETAYEHPISIYSVYNAFIENNVIDIDKLNDKNATEREQAFYEKYQKREASVKASLKSMMDSSNTTIYEDMDAQDQAIQDLLYNLLVQQGILDTSNASNDSMVDQWQKGTIGLSEFLMYAITNNWIDISNLDLSAGFLNSDDIYSGVVDYLILAVDDNKNFSKIIYKYLIEDDVITGKEICLMLYEQGVLDQDSDYEELLSDGMTSYDWITKKIYNMEITPDYLALDPCSGSAVVTDPNNGQVLALVSYPGYDTNRVGDDDYFTWVLQNESLPLYNRATMQKTAPGSTFKMLMAAAGLNEGVITPATYITDQVTFSYISPSPKCWSSSGHGAVDVTDALKESCNYFFYTVGYDMGMDENGSYNSELGVSKIADYCKMFGFGDKSGIELEEAEPSVSDTDAVRSSIGQATHSYTPSQLARYVTALASKGNVYNLSILDKLTDSDGNVITDYTPEIVNHLEFSETIWDEIFTGMYKSTNNTTYEQYYKDLNIDIASKSGTAQENDDRPDHGLFVSFAPLENPEIAVTVVLPFGYGAANAGIVARNIYAYYYKVGQWNSRDWTSTANTDTSLGD